jgi:hypothetical protein
MYTRQLLIPHHGLAHRWSLLALSSEQPSNPPMTWEGPSGASELEDMTIHAREPVLTENMTAIMGTREATTAVPNS